jgi:hypothetical protein
VVGAHRDFGEIRAEPRSGSTVASHAALSFTGLSISPPPASSSVRKRALVAGGKLVKSFKVIQGSGGSAGTTRSFNSNGQVVLHVTCSDNGQAIVRVNVP